MDGVAQALAPVLAEPGWRARADAHAARVDALVAPHLERRRSGVSHPVHDFLFTYYSQRPAQLRRWHPGHGVRLAGGAAYEGLTGYVATPEGATVSTAHVVSQRPLLISVHALLSATKARAPHLGCFGMHEWAMVHRADDTRHPHPLRLGQAGTDAVVESHRVACSHFDAYRFFTPTARPLNTLSPAADDRPAFEQPACLHAGMDLYKHAFRLTPMVPSDLVVDAFELAWEIRVLDMRAAPYDMTGLRLDDGEDWTPVRIETPEGKQEYVAAQRRFAERGQVVRRALLAQCARLLALAAD